MKASLVVEHILITILGSGIGLSGAIALRALVLAATKTVRTQDSSLVRLSKLAPWRTVAAGLLLLIWFPALLLIRFGPGMELGVASVAASTLLLSTFFLGPAESEGANRQFLNWRFIATTGRSITILAVVLTAHFGIFGGAGLGFFSIISLRVFDYRDALDALFLMVSIALAIDLAFGLVDYLRLFRAGKESPV